MKKNMTFHKKKIWVVFVCCILMMSGLIGRLVYLMCFRSDHYYEKAKDLHERERDIKAARGKILDAKGNVLASNRTVCTISVIHSQIKEPEKVIALLTQKLKMDEATVRKRVEKVSSIERVKTNVEKSVGDEIRESNLAGVKVDEDYKRYYPYGSLASKVIGFTGGDNQGIIGLEVKYEDILKGEPGKILTTTDARGVEIDKLGETRQDPEEGKSLILSLDANIQEYAQQAALKVMEEKQAERVSILLMNPQNGEIYACVNVPEFDLNDPFTLNEDLQAKLDMREEQTIEKETEQTAAQMAAKTKSKRKQELLNQMWRNPCMNDTYEPGSTFKIITMSAGLEAGVVTPNDRFYCPGYKLVEDRRIHCAKRIGHGSQNFVEGAQNSCNPVFIEVGLRLGVDCYYKYFRQFGLLDKTGIDLPGEAGTIMHQKKNMGEVELATVSFGQSFQITPVQLATTVSSLINGGRRITPHFGVAVLNPDGTEGKKLEFPVKEGIVSEETSKKVREILETVVSQGSGKNAKIEGYSIGGKTATSQTLPRSANRYISSFLGFAPAENPQVLGLCIIHNPQGIYYGGTIAAPVIRSIFENILPYLGIEKDISQTETETPEEE
jgi:stage V sporulation protein D (sporulation-specific penicillin-binding protein)